MDHTKDYYSILGVTKNASEAEIKKAYRALAKKYHPDKRKGDSKSEDGFKSISEAYDVIGNSEKRKKYDQICANPFSNFAHQRASTHRGFSEQEINMDDLGDIFGSFFGGSNATQSSKREQHSLDSTLINLFIPYHLAVSGGEYLFQTPRGKRIRLKIPKKCPFDHKMKLSSQGKNGENLILSLKFLFPENVKQEGLNIIQTINVPVWDALLGEKVEILLYNGKKINVTINAGTASHTKLKLAKMGLENNSTFGDCYLDICLLVPKHLSIKQKEMIQSLKYNTTV